MRCVGCEHKTKGKRLQDSGPRCKNCGHAFVADPPTDVFTDVAVRAALRRVTTGDVASFLPEHLGYELLRRIAARRRRLRVWLVVVGLGALALVSVVWHRAPPTWLAILVGMGGLAVAGLAHASRQQPDVFALAARYLAVNPSPLSVPSAEALTQAERARPPSGLTAAKRALVCQHRRHCDFLLANAFHLHNACPVVGPDGYRAELYPGLLDRLAREPGAAVFILHDYTPAGLAFATRVPQSPPWLGRGEAVTLLDVGLSQTHRDALSTSLRPIASIPGGASPAAVPRDLGAELTAVRPAVLLAALETSLETRAPLALRPRAGWSFGVDDSE